jgi:hypothetical protein
MRFISKASSDLLSRQYIPTEKVASTRQRYILGKYNDVKFDWPKVIFDDENSLKMVLRLALGQFAETPGGSCGTVDASPRVGGENDTALRRAQCRDVRGGV